MAITVRPARNQGGVLHAQNVALYGTTVVYRPLLNRLARRAIQEERTVEVGLLLNGRLEPRAKADCELAMLRAYLVLRRYSGSHYVDSTLLFTGVLCDFELGCCRSRTDACDHRVASSLPNAITRLRTDALTALNKQALRHAFVVCDHHLQCRAGSNSERRETVLASPLPSASLRSSRPSASGR